MKRQRTYQSNSEGLTDTTLLSDDHLCMVERAGYDDAGRWQDADLMVGRWAHARDAHYTEMAAYSAPLRKWEEAPDYSARSNSAMERDNRFMRISWWLESKRVKMSILRKAGRTDDITQLKLLIEYCISGVKARYTASVSLIVGRKQDEWWLLYLRREQKDDILVLARDAWRGK